MNKTDFIQSLKATPNRRTLVMGIVNVTPDSFSDGGEYYNADRAIEHALTLLKDGADLIDIGGESSRPGALPIGVEEERNRVLPVIEGILKVAPETVISLDTYRAEVAREGLERGVTMINDISAGQFEPEILEIAAEHKAPICLMHMQNTPETMQANPTYDDVVAEVKSALLERAEVALRAGCAIDRILIDPGIGFGKTVQHNLQLLSSLRTLTTGPYPVLLGVSRKSFLSKLPGQHEGNTPNSPKERDLLTACLSGFGAMAGVNIVRVHDVKGSRQTVTLAHALREVSLPE